MGRIIISQYIHWKNNINRIKQNHYRFTPISYIAPKNGLSELRWGIK